MLALWDRPQFVWKLIPDGADATPLLKSLAALAATERVGLMRVPRSGWLHPPQTLERVGHQLNELINLGSDGLLENGPSLLHWTRS